MASRVDSWDNNPYNWEQADFTWNIVEITVVKTRTSRGGAFVRKHYPNRPKQHQFSPFDRDALKYNPQSEEYIKLICLVKEKRFEKKNYINKTIKIELGDIDYTVVEARKIEASVEEVGWILEHQENNKISVTINNIKKN